MAGTPKITDVTLHLERAAINAAALERVHRDSAEAAVAASTPAPAPDQTKAGVSGG